MKQHHLPFDAQTAPLQGSNLIEASAGTGKTYSIAILALRLVLEANISVREILMVTFTKAAVAELEERIRLFLRSAWKASRGEAITDGTIASLVEKAIAASSQAAVAERLRDAVLLLDETAVLTIHSFCQQTLNEFAFETAQLFGAEMLPDPQALLDDELNKFWRRHVTVLPAVLLARLWNEEMRAGLLQAAREHLSGKKYWGYSETEDYSLSSGLLAQWQTELEALEAQLEPQRDQVLAYITGNAAMLLQRCEGDRYAKKDLPALLRQPKAFAAAVQKGADKKYMQKLFPELLQLLADCDKTEAGCNEIIEALRMRLNCLAIREIGRGLRQFKLRNNLLSYDDMIVNLHAALVGRDNPALTEALRTKYRAVFVDEFQDTDRQQYEIFHKAFGEETILFYIGDPKQSIYAWRKADIFTYFAAREAVDRCYGMNSNYRSSVPMIGAMNQFFLPAPDFDTFHFAGTGDAIEYIPVESPASNRKGLFYLGDAPQPPVTVFECENSEALCEAVGLQVAGLLQGAYRCGPPEAAAPVRPSDIGILVRTGLQGRTVKQALARLGIPAVTIDEVRVLQCEEATAVRHLLEAMAAPDRSSINRALLSPFTGLHTADLLRLDDETALSCFMRYRHHWQTDGVYTALMAFLADFGVRERLLAAATESGERALSNLLQLTELLHGMQSRKQFSEAELIAWLQRGIEGMATEGDEYEQRVENDEDAVKIVTIHKSKGLEYKIVLAPFLDFVPRKSDRFHSFRDEDSRDYVGIESSRISESQKAAHARQAEQEARRLLYVAITRAVYGCFIFRCKSKAYANSTLAHFLNALQEADPALIRFESNLPATPAGPYQPHSRRPAAPAGVPRFRLQQASWRKLSYTWLAAKGGAAAKGRAQQQAGAYDHFVFSELKRGRKTGDLLHFILERVHFTDNSRWEAVLKDAIRRYAPAQEAVYLPMLLELLEQVLHTPIGCGDAEFPLSTVGWHKRIHEFEFDFPVAPFRLSALEALAGENTNIRIRGDRGEVEGIMNGKMDLFFEQNGRYYILDWKSNYLGDSLENYGAEALAEAMSSENYHLQYLIYCLAAKKYLESRLPDFDYDRDFGGVIYLFLRGMRRGQRSGIFTARPAGELIERLDAILRGGATTAADGHRLAQVPELAGTTVTSDAPGL